MAENTNEPLEEQRPDHQEQTDDTKEVAFADEPLAEAEEETTEDDGPEETPEEKLRRELAEMKDKYLRLYADFENHRRRTAKERLELIGTANADTVKNILPVVDDFERAMQSFESTAEVEPLKEGVHLIYNKLFKTLESKGLKPMDSVGKPFDADLHESIAQFPAPSEEMKGKVIDVTEKGYFLNDRVIRYAKVVVGV